MKTSTNLFSVAGFLSVIILLTNCSPAVTTQPEQPVVVLPASPGPNYVWVDGSWRYNRPSRAYVYREGYWVQPAKPGRTWIAGHWVKTRRGYTWIEGHWR